MFSIILKSKQLTVSRNEWHQKQYQSKSNTHILLMSPNSKKNCQPGSLKKFQFVHCYVTVYVSIVLLKTMTSLQCANNILDILFSTRTGLEFQSTENIISIWINLTVHSICYKVYALLKDLYIANADDKSKIFDGKMRKSKITIHFYHIY